MSDGIREPRGCPTPGACSCLHDAAAERAAILAIVREEKAVWAGARENKLTKIELAIANEACDVCDRIIAAIEARRG